MSDIVERLRTDYGRQWCECEPNTVIDQYRDERHEAADEIERLRARVAELEAAQEWLPLPPEGIVVRTKREGEAGENRCFWRNAEWIEAGQSGRTTVTHHSFAAPTHWMPLPEAPR